METTVKMRGSSTAPNATARPAEQERFLVVDRQAERSIRRCVRTLERLGHKVTLEPLDGRLGDSTAA